MSYTILGKKVLNEYIALATYGVTGLTAYAAMRGGSKEGEVKKTIPEANSSSDEEAAFVRNFVENLEREDAAKH